MSTPATRGHAVQRDPPADGHGDWPHGDNSVLCWPGEPVERR
ncbi:MAG: hypothetical protein ACR2GH_07615 [Pseudonocardia sp.]